MTLHTEAGTLPDLDSALVALARSGLCKLFGDDKVREKSQAQLEYVMSCIQGEEDVMVVLPTGGGKSAGWLVPAKLDKNRVSVIVTPYTAVLNDQLRVAERANVIAQKFTAKTGIDGLREDVQLVFVQPETARSKPFKE